MPTTLEAPALECEQLKVATSGGVNNVDRANNVIRGFVVAQSGKFKTEGRGEFDDRSLRAIVRLMKANPDGLPSYYKHMSITNADQLGSLLGNAKNPRIEPISVLRNGEKVQVQAVLADLHLSPTAFENNPNGPIGKYVLDMAEHESRNFGSSLVLEAAKEHRLHRGRAVLDDNGNPLPPLWRPLQLASVDLVGRGESTDSFLPTQLSAAAALECLSADPERLDMTSGTMPPGSPAAMPEAPEECCLEVGDRVMVNGTPRKEGQAMGTVALVKCYAYGVIFDDLKGDGIFKWYVGEELLEVEPVADGGESMAMSVDEDASKDEALILELELMGEE